MGGEKVLLVEDDQNLCEALLRVFRGKFDMTAVNSGQEGLRLLADQGPFAVIVCDQRMPGMDGLAFLDRAARLAPQAARIMLTGVADLRLAMRAVNEGQVFRFLTKPCSPEVFQRAVFAGLRAHQLNLAEGELRELRAWHEGLEGRIHHLASWVELRDPGLAAHQARVARLAGALAPVLGLSGRLAELAGLVHDLGKVYLPAGCPAGPGPRADQDPHPWHGRQMLLPLANEAPLHEIVHQHHERLDSSGHPRGLAGGEIMIEARLLAVADQLDHLARRDPGGPAAGLDGALAELQRLAGRELDGPMVEAAAALGWGKLLELLE